MRAWNSAEFWPHDVILNNIVFLILTDADGDNRTKPYYDWRACSSRYDIMIDKFGSVKIEPFTLDFKSVTENSRKGHDYRSSVCTFVDFEVDFRD